MDEKISRLAQKEDIERGGSEVKEVKKEVKKQEGQKKFYSNLMKLPGPGR